MASWIATTGYSTTGGRSAIVDMALAIMRILLLDWYWSGKLEGLTLARRILLLYATLGNLSMLPTGCGLEACEI
jgi:hypothetical protein